MQRADEMVSVPQHMTCEEMLEELGPIKEENKGTSDNNL